MKAFGIEIKKQDIRDLFADHGKDIKEGINFGDFTGMMASKMVRRVLPRDPETQERRSRRCSRCLTRIAWAGYRSRI